MKINFDVKRTYKMNGKEYNSLEEMPDDIRKAFEKAVPPSSAPAQGIPSQAQRTTIIFNEREYDSIDAMPREIRQLYEKVLEAAATGAEPSDIDFPEIREGLRAGTGRQGTVSSGALQPQKFESAFSLKTVISALILAAIILVLYLFIQNR